MGHSVNSLGYRLSFYKNWKCGAVNRSSSFSDFLPTLDLFFDRFFRHLGPSFLYSHFFIFGSPVGGKLHLKLFFYNQAWQKFLRHVYRRLNKSSSGRRSTTSLAANKRGFFPAILLSRGSSLTRRYFRFLKWQLEQRVQSVLQPILLQNSVLNLGSISVSLVDSSPLTPPLFARYILFKLKRRYSLARVINSFLHLNLRLLSKRGVIGLFFRAAGRFSKTQRASSLSVKKGKTPFSTISTFVDQFALSINLKYGSCNLTIWVAYHLPS